MQNVILLDCLYIILLTLMILHALTFILYETIVTTITPTPNDDDTHLKIIIKLQTIWAIWNANPNSDICIRCEFWWNWKQATWLSYTATNIYIYIYLCIRVKCFIRVLSDIIIYINITHLNCKKVDTMIRCIYSCELYSDCWLDFFILFSSLSRWT